MPEILTKYPESALAVLKSAGAKCGVGAKQQILTACPPDQFCSLPHGEICVYGIKDVAKMHQMGTADIADMISQVPSIYSNTNIILLMSVCLFGILVGLWLNRK